MPPKPNHSTTPARAGGLLAGLLAVAGVIALLAVPAVAHIAPTPAAVPETAVATISFNVEHGCGESPTTKLEMQLPAGVGTAQAASTAAGWTAAVAGNTITWTGPAQPPHTPFDVSITASMPSTPGNIHFPIIQTCQQGSTSWIEIQQEGQPEPANPAPTVLVLAPGQSAPPTTADADAGSSDTGAPAASATTHATTPTTAKASHKKSSNGGVIAGIVIAVVVVLVAGAGVLSRRSRNAR